MFNISFLKKFDKNMTFEINKNTMLISIAIVVVAIAGVLIFSNKNLSQFLFFKSDLSNNAIAKKSIDYLNSNVLSGGPQASLVNVSEESGLVKIKIKIGANEYDSYATKDGKFLFPQAFDMLNKTNSTQSQNTNSQSSAHDHNNSSTGAGDSGNKAPSCGI